MGDGPSAPWLAIVVSPAINPGNAIVLTSAMSGHEVFAADVHAQHDKRQGTITAT